MYSQHGEDEFIKKHIANIPKFAVEFGALDGIRNSNIRSLLESGWEGLWIEPSKENFSLLQNNIKGLNVKILNIAISDKVGKTKFYYHEKHPGGSSLIHPKQRNFAPINLHKYDDSCTYDVECKRLIDVIDKPVGVMSIDVEDMDTLVLKDMLETNIKPHILIVEGRDGHQRKEQYNIVCKEYNLLTTMVSNQIFKLK